MCIFDSKPGATDNADDACYTSFSVTVDAWFRRDYLLILKPSFSS
jgi:hypothetical protein